MFFANCLSYSWQLNEELANGVNPAKNEVLPYKTLIRGMIDGVYLNVRKSCKLRFRNLTVSKYRTTFRVQ